MQRLTRASLLRQRHPETQNGLREDYSMFESNARNMYQVLSTLEYTKYTYIYIYWHAAPHSGKSASSAQSKTQHRCREGTGSVDVVPHTGPNSPLQQHPGMHAPLLAREESAKKNWTLQ